MTMNQIDDLLQHLPPYFHEVGGPDYVRLLDTPHVWGMAFGRDIMPQARQRQADFERAVVELMQRARFRCDLSSLNSPDPDWVRPILGAIDTVLSLPAQESEPLQFRFLFGQTPTSPTMEPANFTDFKAALIRLVRLRGAAWQRMPSFWMGRFYRLQEGILSSLKQRIFPDSLISTDDDTKMTWNHSKIIAIDGCEALVGGHNLNMDLFRSYPPVHDLSVVVHGAAAQGAQRYLDRMWACGTDLLTKETLELATRTWRVADADPLLPTDPLSTPRAADYRAGRLADLLAQHEATPPTPQPAPILVPPPEPDDAADDLRTLADLSLDVFPMRVFYPEHDQMGTYRRASRMLSAGKYWTGPSRADYQKGSEVMKERLIKGARRSIRMSQMDLISAWKKNWSDHVVCQWVMEALLANAELRVDVVVSPLDAGAGAEGDQYSFGSGAVRTWDLMRYYMTHAIDDRPLDDPDGLRAAALRRLRVAPFFYTGEVPPDRTTEGSTYQWPDLAPEGYTATLKQPSLAEKPPRQGVIGSAAMSVIQASGYFRAKVPSAPGNHSKLMIVDDEVYVVGSDNLYPGALSEFNFVVEGADAVQALIDDYWAPLWAHSGPHALGG